MKASLSCDNRAVVFSDNAAWRGGLGCRALPDGFNLEKSVLLCQSVEAGVEPVKHVHHLLRRLLRAYVCEAHDVTAQATDGAGCRQRVRGRALWARGRQGGDGRT